MKPSDKPAAPTPLAKPVRMKSAGLYGEVGVLRVSRTGPVRLTQARTFSDGGPAAA